MPLSRRTERGLLNALFAQDDVFGAFANEPTLYLALFTAAPNKDGTGGTEANYGGYARVLPEEWAGIQANEGMKITADEVFPEATSGNNLITHLALFDAVTGGNLIAFDEADAAIRVTKGVQPVIRGVFGATWSLNITDCPVSVFPQATAVDANNDALTPIDYTDGNSLNWRAFEFLDDGQLIVTVGGDFEYLVIGGGGGGGGGSGGPRAGAGGGGAGGYRCSVSGESSGGGASAESPLSLSANTYNITVGAGGAGASGGANGSDGANTTFASITAVGGGGGGRSQVSVNHNGQSGGSGGGGGRLGSGASGTASQGSAGGDGSNSSPEFSGGGGGGAAAVGVAGITSGNGGAGISSSITGTAVSRAGGGGGGSRNTAGSGTAGGGNGGVGTGSGASATANTGSGGGGCGSPSTSATANGGNGGKGLVVVRFRR
jgi:hypothetical protein